MQIWTWCKFSHTNFNVEGKKLNLSEFRRWSFDLYEQTTMLQEALTFGKILKFLGISDIEVFVSFLIIKTIYWVLGLG